MHDLNESLTCFVHAFALLPLPEQEGHHNDNPHHSNNGQHTTDDASSNYRILDSRRCGCDYSGSGHGHSVSGRGHSTSGRGHSTSGCGHCKDSCSGVARVEQPLLTGSHWRRSSTVGLICNNRTYHTIPAAEDQHKFCDISKYM